MGSGSADITVVLEAVLVLGVPALCVFVAAPWLLGRFARARGFEPPDRRRRIRLCFWAALGAAIIGPLAALFLMAVAQRLPSRFYPQWMGLAAPLFVALVPALFIALNVLIALWLLRLHSGVPRMLTWPQWIAVALLLEGPTAAAQLAFLVAVMYP